jgi:hypothetical protein
MKIKIIKILDFKGKNIKTVKLDEDFEPVLNSINCPVPECNFTAIKLIAIREHILTEHDANALNLPFNYSTELTDLTSTYAIIELLIFLSKDGKSLKILRNNDSYMLSKVWAVAWKAFKNAAESISMPQDQYEWLHSLLNRPIPVDKPEEESISVATHLFGIVSSQVIEALKES